MKRLTIGHRAAIMAAAVTCAAVFVPATAQARPLDASASQADTVLDPDIYLGIRLELFDSESESAGDTASDSPDENHPNEPSENDPEESGVDIDIDAQTTL